MKKKNLLSGFIISAVLSIACFSFNCQAMKAGTADDDDHVKTSEIIKKRGLVFLDEHLGPDKMDFLLKKYGSNPDVQREMEDLPSETFDFKMGQESPWYEEAEGNTAVEKCKSLVKKAYMATVNDPVAFLIYVTMQLLPIDMRPEEEKQAQVPWGINSFDNPAKATINVRAVSKAEEDLLILKGIINGVIEKFRTK